MIEMRPLPEKANQIYELVYYKGDFEEAERIFNQISDPIEKCLARASIINFQIWFSEDEKVLNHIEEFRKEIEIFEDPFMKFWAEFNYLFFFGFYYSGSNNPEVNFLKSNEYWKASTDLINKNEELLKRSEPWFYHLLMVFKHVLRWNITDNLDLSVNIAIENLSLREKVPFDGEQIKAYGGMYAIGRVKMQQGKLDEAYDYFQWQPPSPTNWTENVRLDNLANLEAMRGNLDKAINLKFDSIKKNQENNFTWGVYRGITHLASYLLEKNDLKKARDYHLQSLEMRKQHSNPIEQIMGYYELIRHLTVEFSLNFDKDVLVQAKNYFQEMLSVNGKFHDNITVTNFTKISDAIIKKYGRLKDRGEALTILEQLVELYPRFTIFKIDIIEILLEDAQLSNDPEIIIELDNKIEEISKLGLFQNNGSPSKYIQYQIIVARYIFYLKNDPTKALEILLNSLDIIEPFNLVLLKDQVKIEIEKINQQKKQWDGNSTSIQDRIREGEINDYVKKAFQVIAK
jgi:tetratricopeptide (TPR) repeat protein